MVERQFLRTPGRLLLPLAAFVALALLVVACGEKPAPPPAAPEPAKQAGVKEKKGPDLTLPELPEVSVFDEKAFDPKLFRDPFKPFIRVAAKEKAQAKKVVVPQTPLQRFPVEELKLAGILWSKERPPEALIEDPQGKGYRVRTGTFVGNRGAKIVKIFPDGVVLEEIVTDALGEETVNSITIKLHKLENEVNQ